MQKPLTLVIFGITSNLAQLKLIPALYDLAEANILPQDIKILGVARQPKDHQEIKDYFSKVLHSENRHHQHSIKEEVFKNLVSKVSYMDGNLDDSKFYQKLSKFISTERENSDLIFYLATYPDLYADIFKNLKEAGLNEEKGRFVRLMIEKPIGDDLASAKQLNELLLQFFYESQIYRLDHYLGKETLQNILTFRFANNTFENLINKEHIDHIQVTALEDFGIGMRGGYYDSVGALKDVGQNHLLQMLTFATMDHPDEFNNQEITKERIKVLKSLTPDKEKIIFGQYKGYQDEANVAPDSRTDTFFAFKTQIENDRFKGVPIYIRAGKKLNQSVTEVCIVFKKAKLSSKEHKPNVLIYRIQPNEGIVLMMLTKKPGHTTELESTYMQFCYRDFGPILPDAYERLIADAIRGEQTFFNDAKEIEAEWEFIDPLFKERKDPIIYEPGTYGPKEADELIQVDGREWLEPSMLFCKI